jgi:hypothetical protein
MHHCLSQEALFGGKMSVEPAVHKTVPTDYVGHAANVQTDTSNRRGCRTAGSTGNRVVQLLVQSGLLVRALVHQVDERSERLTKAWRRSFSRRFTGS